MAENPDLLDHRSPNDIVYDIHAALQDVESDRTSILDDILLLDKKLRDQGISPEKMYEDYFEELGSDPVLKRALLQREQNFRDLEHKKQSRRLRQLFGYPKRLEFSRSVALKGLVAVGISALLGKEESHPIESKTYVDSAKSAPNSSVQPTSPVESVPTFSVQATATPTSGRIPMLPEATPTSRRGELPVNTPTPEATPLPTKEQMIHYPPELTYDEVRPWVGKMRNSHEAILSESLFVKELGLMPSELRERVLDAIAEAHAQALMNHYGDNEAVIGLDPGHGGDDADPDRDVGSSFNGQVEKELTWDIAKRVSDKLFALSKGKYHVIFLRPKTPKDENLDGDDVISPIERIQKRKAQLLKMEQEIRMKKPQDIGKNIVYLSIHFNGSANGNDDPNARGTEVYYPNEFAMRDDVYREGSKGLALDLQRLLLEYIQRTGYEPTDLEARVDPDSREPLGNSERTVGPYIVLSSPKLDRILQ